MSHTTRNVTPTIPQQASRSAARAEPEPTGWVGWILFGGMMMAMLGAFHAIQGLVALFQSDYYMVGPNGLTVHVDYTAWGWTQLIGGGLVLATGLALLAGQGWARYAGIGLALLSALLNIAFLAAFPIWCTIMIALDVLVIWALTVHGDEMRTMRE